MSDQIKRNIPLDVRRFLRREACFGCAKCGSPILDYHHIIPFSDQAHHEPEHMIALCPTHHCEMAKKPRHRCYELKANPYNKQHGKLRGELGTDAKFTSFLVGSNTYKDTPVIFSYFGQPIISYYVQDGQILLDPYIPKIDMWPNILIRKNDVIINSDDKWDVDFRTNFLKFEKKKNETYFQIDVRKPVAQIKLKFSIRGRSFEFTPLKTNVEGLKMVGNTFLNCGCGIAEGDGRHRLLWPNYAMVRPVATLVEY